MTTVNCFGRLLPAIARRCDLSGPLSRTLNQRRTQLANMSAKPSSGEVEIVRDEQRRRFRTHDAKAYLSYEIRPSDNPELKPDVLDLQHTFVPASFRGQGVAGHLCVAAFEHAKEKGLRVQPTCSYVSDTFLPRNPAWKAYVVEDGTRSGL